MTDPSFVAHLDKSHRCLPICRPDDFVHYWAPDPANTDVPVKPLSDKWIDLGSVDETEEKRK